MRPKAPSGKQQTGIRAALAHSLSRGQARKEALGLLLIGLLSLFVLVRLFYASGNSGTTSLTLTVGEQQALAVVGSNVSLKIRLISGVTANLWGASSCDAPIQKAMAITASGSYTIPLANVPHQDRVYLCLRSSDGKLNASVVWPPVQSDNTTTAITSHSPNPSVVGQQVAVGFTVTPVTAGVGTPTGNVTVKDGSGDACTGTVAAGSCSITFATSGAQTLTASYIGDDNFNASTSSGVTHTVNRTNTTTVIASHTPNPSMAGQPVTVGFTVTSATSGLGALTGNVTVSDGLGGTCTGTVAAGNCSIAFATSGAKTITASYAGDTTYNPSTSAAIVHIVRDFSISMAPASQNVKAGAATTFTLTVTPSSGFTGTVNLACGGTPPNSTCSMSPSSIVLSGPSAGTRDVTVQTGNSTTKGTYTLSVTGTFGTGVPASGGLTHSTTGSIKVN